MDIKPSPAGGPRRGGLKPSTAAGMARQSAVSSAMAGMGWGKTKPEAGPLERKVASSPRGGTMSRLEANEATGKGSKYDTSAKPNARMYARGGGIETKGKTRGKFV